MARSSSSSGNRRHPLALALAALLAVMLVPVFAQEGPPTEPPVPNIEPEALLAEGVAAEPDRAMSEEQAVRAALEAYAERNGPGLAESEEATFPVDVFNLTERRIYLPHIAHSSTILDPGQNPPPTSEPEPDPRNSADVAVTIWPTPSIIVRPGATITYEIRLHNTGQATARETRVVFPYNRSQVTLLNSVLDSRAGDFVSSVGQDSYTIVFGPLARDGRRTGRVVLQVNSGLPIRPTDPVRLDVRASYSWRDGNSGGTRRANWTPVLVGNGASHAPYIWVRVTPDRGPVGTVHAFYTNRLLPGEPVSTWVNLQGGGIRPLSLRGTANSSGEIELRLRSTDADPDLPRGTHQIVIYGQRSNLTGVATFIVQ